MNMINCTVKTVKSKYQMKKIKKHFSQVDIFQRKRKFKNNNTLAQLFMDFIISGLSLFSLSIKFASINNEKISDTALKKTMQKSDKFKLIYDDLLNSREHCKIKTKKVVGYKQCFALDTTYLKSEGKNAEVYRIHSSYALTKNVISDVNVTDSHVAESVTNFEIVPESLYLADRAYCTAAQLTHVLDNNADFIFRMKYDGVRLFRDEECKKQINLVEFLSNTNKKVLSKSVYINHNGKVNKIRVVAKKLDEKAKDNNLKAAKKSAQKRGSNLKPETIKMCEWLVLTTSIKKKSPQIILKAYRLRWQIELLFKRFKSFLHIHKIRKASKNYAFSFIYLALILFFGLELFVELNEEFFARLDVKSIWVKFAVAFSFAVGFS